MSTQDPYSSMRGLMQNPRFDDISQIVARPGLPLNLQSHLSGRLGDQSYLYGNQYQQHAMPKQQTTTIIDPKILQQAENIDLADKFE